MLTSEKRFILGSQSPRRQELLRHIVKDFGTYVLDVDESFPTDMDVVEIASHLAQKKAGHIWPLLDQDSILLTADSIVVSEHRVLNKPEDENHAYEMLSELAGKWHEVHTGYHLQTREKSYTQLIKSEVKFAPLSEAVKWYYIRQFKPFDKAGSYGIQDWIGFIGVESIRGSYSNIMGLPVQSVYKALIQEFEFQETPPAIQLRP